ncbi:hypothetical protein [Neobacillus massiliamazoniensis]|uniref:hypothetical protein n=1 Tax=Neobacillus massiliamazoniensis TaxID=1499688 RepID=UPI000ADA72E8|nr:hypothetical protein [Neobacillus massiliamazoniensis]
MKLNETVKFGYAPDERPLDKFNGIGGLFFYDEKVSGTYNYSDRFIKKGANIVYISKTLGHSNLAVTSQYLHLDKAEVVEN